MKKRYCFVWLFLSIFIGSCKREVKIDNIYDQKVQFHALKQLLYTNLFNKKDFVFPRHLKLTSEKGDEIIVDSLFNSTKLVLRFNYSCCEKCIEAEVEKIQTFFNVTSDIIGIGTYESVRNLKIIKQKLHVNFPVYFLPLEYCDYLLPKELEELYLPYVFVMDEDLTASRIFIPSINFPEISDEYYHFIKQHYFENTINGKNGIFPVNIIRDRILKYDQEYTFKFKYFNKSRYPLIINDVKTTCGCTVPLWRKVSLLPGDSAQLEIKFKPENKGFYHKKIFVFFEKQSNPSILILQGIVE